MKSLRERNATERWRQLQQQWQPQERQAPAAAKAPLPAVQHSGASVDASTDATGNDKAPASEPAGDLPRRLPPLPESSTGQPAVVKDWRERAPQDPQTKQEPVWTIPQNVGGLGETKRGAATLVNLNQAPPLESPPIQQTQAVDDARPKPITAILPYYDYSPDGDNPCDLLCPRQEDCPEGVVAKPCPELVMLPDSPFEQRTFADAHVTWEASNLFSNPLYFEDAPLERYGHTHGPLLQPFVSLGKFGAQLVGIPYQMALHPVHEHRYALGWYRPGECAPYKYYLPPWNPKAALTAGAAYTGLIFLIP